MKSNGYTLIQYDWCSCKGKFGNKLTCGENTCKLTNRLIYKSRTEALGEKPTMSQSSSFRNSEEMNLFKLPSLWYFVQQPLQIQSAFAHVSPLTENVPSFHPHLISHSTWNLNSHLVKLSQTHQSSFFLFLFFPALTENLVCTIDFSSS